MATPTDLPSVAGGIGCSSTPADSVSEARICVELRHDELEEATEARADRDDDGEAGEEKEEKEEEEEQEEAEEKEDVDAAESMA
jgi:hypothetical protein